jgi:aryl-alcohol dehydrogenase-like predicted oxidoreductase
MRITRVGFGAWAIGGGGWSNAWGSQDDADSVAAIQRAVESGINWIATAAVYGLGHSEQIVRGIARYSEGGASVCIHQRWSTLRSGALERNVLICTRCTGLPKTGLHNSSVRRHELSTCGQHRRTWSPDRLDPRIGIGWLVV